MGSKDRPKETKKKKVKKAPVPKAQQEPKERWRPPAPERRERG
ncbi:MAG: hypothetical protein WAT58_03085 [Candidatus Dormiibacterota bacterium]